VSGLTPEQINSLLRSAGTGATVYLVGAGGCGMSGLAHLLLDSGYRVHGSDAVKNEEIIQLRARGAKIHLGHFREHLSNAAPVLVVYSPAIHANNPELELARQTGLPIARRALLLAAIVNAERGICVAGMHGKTTTSALLAWALKQLGASPSYAVGALLPQMQTHARLSATAGAWFVAETDESDGTLNEFRPTHSILLNVDDEHLDYFANVEAVCREFEQFVSNTRDTVVFCSDDDRVAQLMKGKAGAVSYGFSPQAHYRIEAKAHSKPGQNEFRVWNDDRLLGDFSIALLGDKNMSNAAAVIALLHQLGYQPSAIAHAIADFRGATRRQQELFSDENVRVFDDYGHHPNEILAVLRAFKQLNPERLVVAFQPHRYTRTLKLMDDFAGAFGDADKLILTDVYAASEKEISGANSATLAEALRKRGQNVDYVPALTDVTPAVLNDVKPGDLILFLGAGDITKAAHETAHVLRRCATSSLAHAMNTPSSSTVFEKLSASVSPQTVVRAGEPLAKRTTLRVGGAADFFAEPANEADLAGLLKFSAEQKLPFTIIGRGSNLLIRDGGIRGLVISLGHEHFSRVQIVGEHMHCGAGAKLKIVSVEARRAGLAGLEFLEGIPGSVGGALRMNAGAMGSWMFEVVEQIRFMDFSGNVQERRASEVNVEYRGCPLFKTHIALGAVLHGKPASKEVIQERANQYNSKRWETQPAQPSAGCIFKNPQTVPAGKLIDELGLKGTKRGGAMISTIHGNFIVNEGNATAKDVLELIDFVKQTAREKRGIELQTEVEIIGE
jgi:UDP-N-acetylmuramate--alanine ligase